MRGPGRRFGAHHRFLLELVGLLVSEDVVLGENILRVAAHFLTSAKGPSLSPASQQTLPARDFVSLAEAATPCAPVPFLGLGQSNSDACRLPVLTAFICDFAAAIV